MGATANSFSFSFSFSKSLSLSCSATGVEYEYDHDYDTEDEDEDEDEDENEDDQPQVRTHPMPARVYVTRLAPEEGLAPLRSAGLEVFMEPTDAPLPRARLLAEIARCDALIPFITDTLDREAAAAVGPRLRVLACCSVGIDHIDVPAFTERGVWVTNTPGVLTDATAELTWALILAAARRIVSGDRVVREGRWRGWSPLFHLGVELRGKTLGIVGAGRIGRAVARTGVFGFGMKVAYASPREHPDWTAELGARRLELDALIAEADVLSLHCPLTPETRGLLGRERLARMKPHAVLVNTARGPLIDEPALAEALRAGRPGSAGLDVFAHEPEVPAAFLGLENIVLLPHLGTATRETRARMLETAALNALAVLSGKAPPNPVNLVPASGR